MELKGSNGTIVVYDDRVVIQRKGLFAWATQGMKGDAVYFYSTLAGVDYKKPGLTDGFIRFVLPGTVASNIKVGTFDFKDAEERMADPNTVVLRSIFRPSVADESEKIYNYILNKMNDAKRNVVSVSASSSADEIRKYKELLDDGIISQEEFDKKKKQLLNQ